jgi:hypothetical protein
VSGTQNPRAALPRTLPASVAHASTTDHRVQAPESRIPASASPGTGSSITSMIVSSTGTTTCLGAFLGTFLAAVFGGRFFLTAGFGAPLPARRTLDFAALGVVRFAQLPIRLIRDCNNGR